MLNLYTISLLIFAFLVMIAFSIVGFNHIKDVYTLWTKPWYWTTYNRIEAALSISKIAMLTTVAVVGHPIWWLNIGIVLFGFGSIWVCNKKSLPTSDQDISMARQASQVSA